KAVQAAIAAARPANVDIAAGLDFDEFDACDGRPGGGGFTHRRACGFAVERLRAVGDTKADGLLVPAVAGQRVRCDSASRLGRWATLSGHRNGLNHTCPGKAQSDQEQNGDLKYGKRFRTSR